MQNRTLAARWAIPVSLLAQRCFSRQKPDFVINGHLLFVDGGMLVAV